MKRIRPPGRPARTFVDRAQSILWMESALAAAKVRTVSSFKEKFELYVPLPTLSVLHKYVRGEASPSEKVVEALADAIPITGRVFHHPLWALARPHPVSGEFLADQLKLLPKRFTKGWLRPGHDHYFWREPAFDMTRLTQVVLNETGLAGAALALAVVDDALLRQDEEGHFLAWRTWARLAEEGRSGLGSLYPYFFCKVLGQARDVSYLTLKPRAMLSKALECANQAALLEMRLRRREAEQPQLSLERRFRRMVRLSPLGEVLESEWIFLMAMAGSYPEVNRQLAYYEDQIKTRSA